MAARFTEHSGDPAWLKSQREAQARATNVKRVHRAMPYPTATTPPPPTVMSGPDTQQFRQAANAAGNVAFVLGWVAMRRALKGRKR